MAPNSFAFWYKAMTSVTQIMLSKDMEDAVMQIDDLSLDELKELGAGVSAPEGVVLLYRQAFRDFGAQSLRSHAGIKCGYGFTGRAWLHV
ncbi:MAG: hypothetical protein HQK96_15300 [Nitrospirae bacterium]|nr:hypothetical protein [Nitrospirota bacterium]